MQRFPDLDRAILLAIEADDHEGGFVDLSEVGNFSAKQVGYQVGLLRGDGLIEAIDARTSEEPFDWAATQLTAAGHRYLESIRDPEAWRRVKEGARRVGSFGIDTLADLARAIIRQKVVALTGGEFDV